MNAKEEKKEIQMYYIDTLLSNNCSKAAKALEEMKKIDPDDSETLKYNDKKLKKVVTLPYSKLKSYINKCNSKNLSKSDIEILKKAGVFHAENLLNQMNDLQE